MAVTVTFTVNERFNFEFTIGVQYGEGIVVNPDDPNLNDPGFLDALKSAAKAFPVISDVLRLDEEADCFAQEKTTDQELRRHLWSAPDDYLERMTRCYEVAQHQSYTEVSAAMRRYAEAIRSEVERRQTKQQKDKADAEKHQLTAPGYVYLIQSPTGVYKIGRSKNPKNRIKTFNVKLPFEIEYIALIPSSDMYALESKLHQQYADKRVNGEWFNLAPEDVEYIKGLGS